MSWPITGDGYLWGRLANFPFNLRNRCVGDLWSVNGRTKSSVAQWKKCSERGERWIVARSSFLNFGNDLVDQTSPRNLVDQLKINDPTGRNSPRNSPASSFNEPISICMVTWIATRAWIVNFGLKTGSPGAWAALDSFSICLLEQSLRGTCRFQRRNGTFEFSFNNCCNVFKPSGLVLLPHGLLRLPETITFQR